MNRCFMDVTKNYICICEAMRSAPARSPPCAGGGSLVSASDPPVKSLSFARIENREGINMGNRLAAILSTINVFGMLGCILLIAAASQKDPLLALHVTEAIRHSFRMFIVGAALPAVALGIGALELDRANARLRLYESWAFYLFHLISLILFLTGGLRLPHSLLRGFQGI